MNEIPFDLAKLNALAMANLAEWGYNPDGSKPGHSSRASDATTTIGESGQNSVPARSRDLRASSLAGGFSVGPEAAALRRAQIDRAAAADPFAKVITNQKPR